MGLTDLKKLFISIKNEKFKDTPSKLFFSQEWIKNVAKIASNLKDTNILYKLYGDLEVIGKEVEHRTDFQILKDITMDFNDDRYEKIICKLSEKVFSKEFLESDLSQYSDNDEVELSLQEDLKENLANIILRLKVSIPDKK